jgi:PadR family transcriptional regulator, regulatory protein PadR
MNISKPTILELKFLSIFVNNTHKKFTASDLAEMLNISYGSVIPLLMRFEKADWLEVEWEDIDPKEAGRPKRKFYGLSTMGSTKAPALLRSEIAFLQGKKVTVKYASN